MRDLQRDADDDEKNSAEAGKFIFYILYITNASLLKLQTKFGCSTPLR